MTTNWMYDQDGNDWITHTRLRPACDCDECPFAVTLSQSDAPPLIDLRLYRWGHVVSHIRGQSSEDVLRKAAASVDPTLGAWLLSLIESAPKFPAPLSQDVDSRTKSAVSSELEELRNRLERLESRLAEMEKTTDKLAEMEEITDNRLDEISAALHGAAALFENVQ